MTLPVFEQPPDFELDLSQLSEGELQLMVEEGRREIDWQWAQLERLRNRAATLLTVALAEIAILAAGAQASWNSNWYITVAWVVSGTSVLLGAAGVAAVLTGKAIIGGFQLVDLAGEGASRGNMRLAWIYAANAPIGRSTLNTFLTVTRDAVLLLVLGAVIFAAVWPWRG